MTFQQHYLMLVPGLRSGYRPHWCCRVTPPVNEPGWSVSWENSCSREIGGKGAGGSCWSPKWRFRSETKISPRGAYPRGLRMGRGPVVMIGIVGPFTPHPPGVGIPGKLLFSRYQDVKVFEGVGNDLPAALPLASPKLKILMAPHWCCRVTPRAGYPRCRYPGKTLVLEKLGVKVQGGLGEVQNVDLVPKRRLAPGVPIPEA